MAQPGPQFTLGSETVGTYWALTGHTILSVLHPSIPLNLLTSLQNSFASVPLLVTGTEVYGSQTN